MENQDLDLIGQTVGNMPYKIGIIDKDGNLKNQFVTKSSTNRIDIPESALGADGVPQLPANIILFSGSAVGDISLVGPTPDYSNVQDGISITLSSITSQNKNTDDSNQYLHMDLSSIGLKPIKIPKGQLTVGNSFDISDQLSPYIGKAAHGQFLDKTNSDYKYWVDIPVPYNISSFEGTTIKVLPNITFSMNLIVHVKPNGTAYFVAKNPFPIPVSQVNTYKN